MSGLPWYAHNIEKYERKTAHLTMVQHGAYRLMMDHYYKTAAPLPAKLEQVHRICRAVAEDEQATVSAVLSEFFELKSDGWHNKQADEELAKMAEISGKRRKAAKTGHECRAKARKKSPPKLDANAPANAPTSNTEHISSLRSDIIAEPPKQQSAPVLGKNLLPDWLPVEQWAEFVQMRQRIRAPLAPGGIKKIIAKLTKFRAAGEDIAAVLDESIEKSYRGVFPVKQSGGRNGGRENKPAQQSSLSAISRAFSERNSGLGGDGLFAEGGDEIVVPANSRNPDEPGEEVGLIAGPAANAA